MKITDTEAYKTLPELSQKMVMKRVNRVEIEDQIIICRTIGIEKWKTITPLGPRAKSIVEEIINNEQKQQQDGN